MIPKFPVLIEFREPHSKEESKNTWDPSVHYTFNRNLPPDDVIDDEIHDVGMPLFELDGNLDWREA